MRLLAPHVEDIIEAQHAAATGVNQVGYRDEHGRFKLMEDADELRAAIRLGKPIRVYTRLPNVQAQTDVLNRILDKPAEQEQKVTVTGTIELVERLAKARKRSEVK